MAGLSANVRLHLMCSALAGVSAIAQLHFPCLELAGVSAIPQLHFPCFAMVWPTIARCLFQHLGHPDIWGWLLVCLGCV